MSDLGNDPSAQPPQTSAPPPRRGPEIGVVFRPQSAPERLREVVLSAEAAGVAELWLWEDCFAQGGLTSAAAALAWTQRLRVGVGLLPVPLRNPALAAMEIATLARLFPGRFVPGLGHGVLDWMGQVGSRVLSPMTLLREYTVAVRGLLHGDTVDVDGRYVHLDDVALDWPPRQVPPLLLGARGPKTLRLAGEVADGVILDSGVTPEMVRAARPEIDAGTVAARRTDPLRVVAFVEVGTSAEQVVDGAAAYGEAGVDVVVFQASSEDPDAEPLIAACAALGRG
ncbi:MAG: LLM class flavin-dependent oxidoreductase [Pseudonocardia sp.]|nr:LLM class flavin-dependent oxidoreductase [Pseudonocardia sp.]